MAAQGRSGQALAGAPPPPPRDVLEGGGGGGGWLGPSSSLGPPMVPAEGRPKIFKLKSSWGRRRRSKILALRLQHWKGRGGGGGSREGTPPPPTVYVRSNTSLPPSPRLSTGRLREPLRQPPVDRLAFAAFSSTPSPCSVTSFSSPLLPPIFFRPVHSPPPPPRPWVQRVILRIRGRLGTFVPFGPFDNGSPEAGPAHRACLPVVCEAVLATCPATP